MRLPSPARLKSAVAAVVLLAACGSSADGDSTEGSEPTAETSDDRGRDQRRPLPP